MSHDELSNRVRELLREAFAARFRGELHAGKVRLQSYADGYMRALCDCGLVSPSELLSLVSEVRTEAARPQEEPAQQIAAVG